ncbi:MAG: hypothetical protein HYV28_00480 [Ignavibacteriales bacterium]|nr:hypothetical protein [Ignavibacteriales bacterium]
MDNHFWLYACGIYNFAIAIFHIAFWKIFRWPEDLKKTTPANRAIIQILNIRLIYIFLLMAVLYFFFQEELLNSRIGTILLIGFAGFWIGRTIEQFIFLRGKSKMVTILTVILFTGIVIHVIPLL